MAAGDVRRKDAQIHDAAVGAVFVHHVRLHAQQSGYLAQRIVETRRELHAPLLGAARQREARQVQHPCIEVLGRGVDRERVAPVGGVDERRVASMRLRSTYSDVALSESWSLAGLKSSCSDEPSAI